MSAIFEELRMPICSISSPNVRDNYRILLYFLKSIDGDGQLNN